MHKLAQDSSFCHHLNEYVHCCVISCQTVQLKAEEMGKWVSDWKENPIDNIGAFKKKKKKGCITNTLVGREQYC